MEHLKHTIFDLLTLLGVICSLLLLWIIIVIICVELGRLVAHIV